MINLETLNFGLESKVYCKLFIQYLDSLRQRVEEAVDIIVRHGFATTDGTAPVTTSANTSAPNVSVSTSDGTATGSAGPNSIENTSGTGTSAVSVQSALPGGVASGHGSSSSEHSLLPDMDVFNLSGGLGANKLKKEEDPPPAQEEQDDNAALFYSPGKRGFYSPVQGRATPERLNAFRNVGRLMGLCLLQNELCPLFFNRHVIKHLLSRKVRFHDLAFFDPVIYESLRQLVVDAENKVSHSIKILIYI